MATSECRRLIALLASKRSPWTPFLTNEVFVSPVLVGWTLTDFRTVISLPVKLPGHSERRQYHAESDELVAAKLASAVSAGLQPIVCVG